jgi:hypothetical protein
MSYRSRYASLILAVIISCLGSQSAFACASCGCGDNTLTATGVERPYRNRIRVLLEERYGSLVLGDDATGEHTTFLRQSLAASWSPQKRVTIALVVPWMTSWIRRAGVPRSTVTGLGDVELAGRVVLYQEKSFAPHHVLWAGVGLKFPTGRESRDTNGFPVDSDDRPGSGSWDPYLGVTYGWFSGELFSFFASASGRLTTHGFDSYLRGATIGGTAVLQLQPWSWGALQLGADLLWERADYLGNGNLVPNSGGTTGFLVGAFLANPWRDLLLRVVVDAPVITVMQGTQSVGPQVTLQVAYDFN